MNKISFLFLLFLFSQYTYGQDSIQSIKLLFVGDVMGHGPQIKSAEVEKNESYDYEPCFKYVKPIIQSADLAIGNLEVTLPGKPPYQGYPQFRSPDDLAKALRFAGFDMMVTSNNHSNDAGKSGVIETINTLREYGFYQTGTFKDQQERDWYYPLVVYKNDFKLAFLNYTYGTNGLPTRAPTIVNEIDLAQIEQDMETAKALKPDAIIVLMHWGLEYQLNESKEQNRLTRKIFDWGADLIIGSHPHVIQPIKTIDVLNPDSTRQQKLVTYSLGNFISNQTKPNTDGGLMVEVVFQKKKGENNAFLKEHHYIPVWRYIQKNKRWKPTYYALPVSAFEGENVLGMTTKNWNAMLSFTRRMRKHLNKTSDSSERKITLEELKLEHLYLNKEDNTKEKSIQKVSE